LAESLIEEMPDNSATLLNKGFKALIWYLEPRNMESSTTG
jgi:hypothetical protein